MKNLIYIIPINSTCVLLQRINDLAKPPSLSSSPTMQVNDIFPPISKREFLAFLDKYIDISSHKEIFDYVNDRNHRLIYKENAERQIRMFHVINSFRKYFKGLKKWEKRADSNPFESLNPRPKWDFDFLAPPLDPNFWEELREKFEPKETPESIERRSQITIETTEQRKQKIVKQLRDHTIDEGTFFSLVAELSILEKRDVWTSSNVRYASTTFNLNAFKSTPLWGNLIGNNVLSLGGTQFELPVCDDLHEYVRELFAQLFSPDLTCPMLYVLPGETPPPHAEECRNLTSCDGHICNVIFMTFDGVEHRVNVPLGSYKSPSFGQGTDHQGYFHKSPEAFQRVGGRMLTLFRQGERQFTQAKFDLFVLENRLRGSSCPLSEGCEGNSIIATYVISYLKKLSEEFGVRALPPSPKEGPSAP